MQISIGLPLKGGGKAGVAAPPPFTPTDIAGLQAWYKADGLRWQDSARTTPAVADADPVGALDDYSGNARHLLQATSSKRPTLKLAIQNGLPVIRFDGVDDCIQATFTLNQPHTRFAVMVSRSPQSGSNTPVDGGLYITAMMQFQSANTPILYAGTALTGSSANGSTWHVWRGTFDGASSKINLDGGTVVTGNSGTANAGGVTLGARGSSGPQYCDCDIAEVLEYNTALSDANVTSVLGYLSARWGI